MNHFESSKRIISQEVTQLRRRPFVLGALLAIFVWNFSAWLFISAQTEGQAQKEVRRAEKAVQQGLDDISLGLKRSLTVFHGIPATIGRNLLIQETLHHLAQKPISLSLPRIDRKRLFAEDPDLQRVNRALLLDLKDIPALSVIWVMDLRGTCVASSNSSKKTSFVGTNYADRTYFKEASAGRIGYQFALGRRTNIPGLFFSAPVFHEGKVVGVVGSKIDLPFLTSWVNQTNAFISDSYDVIILAQDKSLEMRTLPDPRVELLETKSRVLRYKRASFEKLVISPWPDDRFPSVLKLDDSPVPMLMGTRSIPGEEVAVSIMHRVPGVAAVNEHFAFSFAHAATIGPLFILVITGIIFFIANRHHARRQREHQEHIEFLATHDALTGLYSRAVLEQVLTQGVSFAKRTNKKFAVLFIDLDLFKDINDTMGHDVGDLVLQEIAQRLKGTVRDSDAVVRHGGDEFVVTLNDVSSPQDVAHVALEILESLQAPFAFNDVFLNISASIGISLYPDDGDTPSLLLRHADMALYRVKDSGRSDFCFYHRQMTTDAMDRLALENEMKKALEQQDFYLVFQPQYCMENKRVVGCEALLRWEHESRGFIPPDEFIPVAEKSGLIVPLGEWVIEEACRQGQAWRARFGRNIPVSVNLSVVQFRRQNLGNVVERALVESGLPPDSLVLELTESLLMEDTSHTLETMQYIESLGVQLAIDDFGTGYSSLAYLKLLDADCLKIDKSFIRDMEDNSNDRAIINAIITLAGSLGCKVIAEGVETEAQANLLSDLKCNLIQGYWYCRPVPPADFVRFLESTEQ